MEKQSVFITGGAGYVGAMLVPRLLKEGHRVTVLDLMIYGEDVLPKNPALTVIKGDIRNQELLSLTFRDMMWSFILPAFPMIPALN